MAYELWDTDSGNLIHSYPTLDEALSLVRSAVASNGRRSVAQWALVSVAEDGTLDTIAAGSALAARAKRPVPA
jgi:hypothetical protein